MPIEPTEAEVIAAAIESRLLDLHTSIPGKVVGFDAASQSVDVQPVVKRAIATYDGELTHEELPIIHNVPVAFPSGGGYVLRLPIRAGDHVWLIFSEAATAQWRTTGQVSEPGDLRRHDLSYACAVPVPFATLPEAAAAAAAPLTPATQARMDCPEPFVFAADAVGQALATFVALADKVDAAMELIKQHVHPTAMGPSGTAASLAAITSVAATKLKAQ